nr:divalent metal cation transporter [Paraburkholderia dipogonis]
MNDPAYISIDDRHPAGERAHNPAWLLYSAVVLLILANKSTSPPTCRRCAAIGLLLRGRSSSMLSCSVSSPPSDGAAGLALHLTIVRQFYAVIALAIVGGVAITVMHFDPIRALYWSSVINGVAAVPITITIIMMLMARSRRVMGQSAVTGLLAWGGWLATLAMAIAALGVFVPA